MLPSVKNDSVVVLSLIQEE